MNAEPVFSCHLCGVTSPFEKSRQGLHGFCPSCGGKVIFPTLQPTSVLRDGRSAKQIANDQNPQPPKAKPFWQYIKLSDVIIWIAAFFVIRFGLNMIQSDYLSGKVIVVTQGMDKVKMFNITVFAVESTYFKKKLEQRLATVRPDLQRLQNDYTKAGDSPEAETIWNTHHRICSDVAGRLFAEETDKNNIVSATTDSEGTFKVKLPKRRSGYEVVAWGHRKVENSQMEFYLWSIKLKKSSFWSAGGTWEIELNNKSNFVDDSTIAGYESAWIEIARLNGVELPELK